MAVSRAKLTEHVISEITAGMKMEGYSLSDPLDGQPSAEHGVRVPSWRRVWFTHAHKAIVGQTTAAICATVAADSRTGGVVIEGCAYLLSQAVERVLRDVPDVALDSSYRPGNTFAHRNYLDMDGFGDLESPPVSDRVFHIVDLGLGDGVERFMDGVRLGAERFFVDRDSLTKLIDLALQQRSADPGYPAPSRFRGVVVLCLINGRIGDAIDLMSRYTAWQKYARADTRDRVVAFDSVLRERFPDYARVRLNELGDR